MLSNVDAAYAEVRVKAIDAEIKELRTRIKSLEAKKAKFTNAAKSAPESDDEKTN